MKCKEIIIRIGFYPICIAVAYPWWFEKANIRKCAALNPRFVYRV